MFVRPAVLGWVVLALAAGASRPAVSEALPRVLVMPALRQGTPNAIAAAESASKTILAELIKLGQVETMPYDPNHPSVERAIGEGKLSAADFAKSGSPEDVARILRALSVDYAVDPKILTLRRDTETEEIVVEMQVAVYDLVHAKPRILDCEAAVRERPDDFSTTTADRVGRAAGQLAAAKIVELIQSFAASGADGLGEAAAALNERARQQMDSGDPDSAIESFRDALRIEPKNTTYRLGLAAAYDAKGRTRDAWLEYRRVTELDSENAAAWAGRGRCLLRLGDAENAVGTLKEAIKLGVESADIRLALGEAYLAQSLIVQAEAELAKVEELAATDADAVLKLGSVYESGDRTKKALAVYQKYTDNDKNPQDPRVEFATARLLSAKGDYRGALERLKRMAQLTDGTCRLATNVDYQVVGNTLDGFAKEISTSTDTAFRRFDDDQLTRAGLHDVLSGNKRDAESVSDFAGLCEPPLSTVEAHMRRKHAAGLLVQAFFSYLAFVESDDAAGKDYGDLLKGEAMLEFGLAQKTG